MKSTLLIIFNVFTLLLLFLLLLPKSNFTKERENMYEYVWHILYMIIHV